MIEGVKKVTSSENRQTTDVKRTIEVRRCLDHEWLGLGVVSLCRMFFAMNGRPMGPRFQEQQLGPFKKLGSDLHLKQMVRANEHLCFELTSSAGQSQRSAYGRTIHRATSTR